jgi:hypothetical protein
MPAHHSEVALQSMLMMFLLRKTRQADLCNGKRGKIWQASCSFKNWVLRRDLTQVSVAQ